MQQIRESPLLRRILRLRAPLIIALILLVPYSYLGFTYIRTAPQQGLLEKQITDFRRIVSGASSRAKDAEAELQAIQKGVPPGTLVETDVFKAMQELATQTGLDPAKLTTELRGAPFRKKVGNTEFRVMSFGMTVSGDYKDVWALIQKLDQGKTVFQTLVLTRTSIVLGAEPVTATLEFVIYTAAQ